LGSVGLCFVLQTRPTLVSLVCSSFSSDQDFAYDFLQIPAHDGHPCPWLVVPTTKPTTDFQHQVVAHAGHIIIKGHDYSTTFYY